MPLTAAEVKNAQPKERDYKLADSKGLHLFVTVKGAKSWRFKYRYADKEKRLTFGLFPEVSLAAARDRRDEAREILRAGKDPAVEIEKRRQAAIAAAGATFRSVADEWHASESPGWSPQYAERIMNRLVKDIYPRLGKTPIADITGRMVLTELRKIEARGSIETAKRVKGYIVDVFKRAKSEHLVSVEAVTAIAEISDALKPSPANKKHPALTKVPELIELQQTVDRSGSEPTTKLGSRLLAITVVRVGVLRTAPWTEFHGIDWDDPDKPAPDAVWQIPPARMKLEVEDKENQAFGHDVPLPWQAVEILRALRVMTGHRELVFPHAARWREPMSDSAISSLYKRLMDGKYKGKMVPHGWRSAFSTIMNERAAKLRHHGDRQMIDMMLAHVPNGISASEWAYNRATYAEPRRELGQIWADMICADLRPPMELIGQAAR